MQIIRTSIETATGPGDYAMQEVDDDGSPVSWGEHVSDEEYGAAPAS